MLTQLHVDLPNELHANLKAAAALNQQTLKEYTIAILREHLNSKPQKYDSASVRIHNTSN